MPEGWDRTEEWLEQVHVTGSPAERQVSRAVSLLGFFGGRGGVGEAGKSSWGWGPSWEQRRVRKEKSQNRALRPGRATEGVGWRVGGPQDP